MIGIIKHQQLMRWSKIFSFVTKSALSMLKLGTFILPKEKQSA